MVKGYKRQQYKIVTLFFSIYAMLPAFREGDLVIGSPHVLSHLRAKGCWFK